MGLLSPAGASDLCALGYAASVCARLTPFCVALLFNSGLLILMGNRCSFACAMNLETVFIYCIKLSVCFPLAHTAVAYVFSLNS